MWWLYKSQVHDHFSLERIFIESWIVKTKKKRYWKKNNDESETLNSKKQW
jgi:hypothetical protein